MEQLVKTDWSWARDGAAPPPACHCHNRSPQPVSSK
ncbi:hypothetical protein E2C01_080599 [Portunus trituberculatus]|uniref:Uncharacterized protein n=1 Tax=Portunus trituberculatus TaxID=210409 RepID=A0A5B7ITV3_PORTR|nr:hypothetical protein [Portunus trituberculatus]